MSEISRKPLQDAYTAARERYSSIGIDVDAAVAAMKSIPLSLHCWQGDDVGGFERPDAALTGGGIQVTGTYPGKARNSDELRADMEMALSVIPGRHRINLHAIYAETGGTKVERNQLGPEHFRNWIDWAKEKNLGIDFNPTFFSHPLADAGFTLSSSDESIRTFWIEHGIACRRISEEIGRQLRSPCVTNFWIPDGYKDTPFDRLGPRERLRDSLDRIFAQPIDPGHNLDSLESKLFGIGSESYVVGSHEFYLAYAIANGKMVCLDTGHFHPTETISDKISSILLFTDRLLLHISRGVRWDSDHVVILDDDVVAIAREIVRGGFLGRVHIGLDFFDASINRIAAWAIGARSVLKALLLALLEPSEELQEAEKQGDLTRRLALLEESRTMPFGAVWDYLCMIEEAGPGREWLSRIEDYEKEVLSRRA